MATLLVVILTNRFFQKEKQMHNSKSDREPLAAYLRQQVICEGVLCKFNRQKVEWKTFLNVCISDAAIFSKASVFIAHCHHVWVNNAIEWDERFDLDEFLFTRIRFRAMVKAYNDRHYDHGQRISNLCQR